MKDLAWYEGGELSKIIKRQKKIHLLSLNSDKVVECKPWIDEKQILKAFFCCKHICAALTDLNPFSVAECLWPWSNTDNSVDLKKNVRCITFNYNVKMALKRC